MSKLTSAQRKALATQFAVSFLRGFIVSFTIRMAVQAALAHNNGK